MDPIRFSAGDINLHRYVGNSVTNSTDPSGLISPVVIWGVLASVFIGLVAWYEDVIQSFSGSAQLSSVLAVFLAGLTTIVLTAVTAALLAPFFAWIGAGLASIVGYAGYAALLHPIMWVILYAATMAILGASIVAGNLATGIGQLVGRMADGCLNLLESFDISAFVGLGVIPNGDMMIAPWFD